MRTLFAVLLLFAAAFAQDRPAGTQQPQTPQSSTQRQPLSPRGQTTFTFADGKQISVDYGRPYMRGRKIMGGLVPYNKIWRTGANEATRFETQADLILASTRVPAGKYSVYTIPGEQSWTIILNKQTGQSGTVYNQEQDLARVTVTPTRLDSPVDQFTISFEQRGPNAGVMKLEWENTSVPVDFSEANQ
ncbi:MAG: DUF2911 domain-containing protein [Terriglobales bacterium]